MDICFMKIDFASYLDIVSWVILVDKVKDLFPGLVMDEYRKTVIEFIERKEAICAKDEEKIVGTLLFSKELNMICFLAVDPLYRRMHIAKEMIEYMLPLLDRNREVIVTTYREDDSKGFSARAFYKNIGFKEGKLTEEFGYPVQEFLLKL